MRGQKNEFHALEKFYNYFSQATIEEIDISNQWNSLFWPEPKFARVYERGHETWNPRDWKEEKDIFYLKSLFHLQISISSLDNIFQQE
jgi:hypothetical protein